MKNITLSVPDEVYRKARLAAARRDTSVSALVAESLRSFASREDPLTVRRRLLEKAFATAATGHAGRLPQREELYDRAVFSRY
jgi:predicted transcriptional regulator